MPTEYGVTRNLKFERQLRKEFGLTYFTTREAYAVYESTRKPSGYKDSMNARNYLAGAIGAGVLTRIVKGVYTFE